MACQRHLSRDRAKASAVNAFVTVSGQGAGTRWCGARFVWTAGVFLVLHDNPSLRPLSDPREGNKNAYFEQT